MFLLRIIRVCSLIFALFAAHVKCQMLHELMTDEEIYQVYRTSRENVPEYEITPIKHDLYRKSASTFRLEMNAFGTDIETFFKPTDGILAGKNTPIWRAFTKSDGTITYEKMREGIVGLVAKSYESFTDLASILVSEEKNSSKLNFHGSFDDHSLRIVPVPERFRQGLLGTTESFKEETAERSRRTFIASDAHVVIRTKSVSQNDSSSLDKAMRRLSRLYNRTEISKSKRSLSDIIYPSLLITTDYKDTNTTYDDLAFCDDIIYQLAFWNAVDLRFRHLENPKVRLRIAGIIFGQDRTATPWIKNHMKNNEIDANAAWAAMQIYWFKQTSHPDFQIDAYNVIVTMTDAKMFKEQNDGTKSNILGLASVRGFCLSNAGPIMASNALTVDHRGFDGVRTAAHELGHVLGATHDVDIKGECTEALGYIMAPTAEITDNAFRWSSCSKTLISRFLRTYRVNCADEPANLHPPGDPIERILPGNVMDADEQCQAQGFYWACDINPKLCNTLSCAYSGFHKFFVGCYDLQPAADGTKCDSNGACVDGRCLYYWVPPY